MDIENLDVRNVQSLIDNYESLVRDLTKEIQNFQIEYSDLNTKIKSVIAENARLSKDITYLILNEEQNANYDNNQTSNKPLDLNLIENLKTQLDLIASEKEYTMQLWHNAVQTIDHLEEELRIFQEGKKDFVSKEEVLKLKKECHCKIKELEEELTSAKVAYNIKKEINKSFNENDVITKESCTKIIKNLEEEILHLQERLKQANKVKEELNKTINKQNKKIQILEDKNKEYVQKVKEAIEIVEAACIEKNHALYREKDAKDEMSKVSKNLFDVLEQAENKLKSEVQQVKSDFNENLREVSENLKKARDDSLIKQNEIETYVKQCALLENEIQRLQNQNKVNDIDCEKTSKLLILEKNLEKTFQKLLTSEKENIILKAEISRIKSDTEDMITHFENDVKTREIQKKTLMNKIEILKNDSTQGDKKYLTLLEELEDMKSKLIQMQQKFTQEMELKKSELKLCHSQELEAVKKKNEEVIEELESQLSAQIRLNQEWRKETKLIISKMEDQLTRQNESLKKMRQLNLSLKRKLRGKSRDRKRKSREDLMVLTNPSQIETKLKKYINTDIIGDTMLNNNSSMQKL